MTDTADSIFTPEAEFAGERRRVIATADVVATVHEPLSVPRGRVILVPGWSGPRSGPADVLAFLGTELAKNGWTAIRFDIPGRGDADGERGSIGLDEMIAAAISATTAVSANAERTFFLGMCSGGNVSLGATTLAPQLNAGVIALSTLPFQPARSKDFERRRSWKNIKQYAAKAVSPRTWTRLIKGEINLDRVKKNVTATEKPASGERNLKDSSRDIEAELREWKAPALFIYGSGDEEAALARAHFEKLHASGMGAPDATQFHTIEGANHNYYSRNWRRELVELILAFLK